MVMLALVVAGCSDSGDDGPQVASAVPPSAAPSAAASAPPAKETDFDKALRYVRCMNDQPKIDRENKDLPDPVLGKSLAVSDFLHTKAFAACKAHVPATWPIQEDAGYLAANREFFGCLRDKGIDLPEPDAKGMMLYPSYDTPQWTAAVDKCIHLYKDAALGTG
ncbi:hypothetical protein ACFQO7_32105 [Catellatospora aurea]|uniref:Lipoprotein n=1 Tax=Catellatospora aurea TaxID=1337874 RepID=A0ABW2H4F1_9ACTN